MKKLLLALLPVLLVACGTGTPDPEPEPQPPVVGVPTPAPAPTTKWEKPKLLPFQIIHSENSLSTVKSRLRSETKILNTDLFEVNAEIMAYLNGQNIYTVAYFGLNPEEYGSRFDMKDYPKEGYSVDRMAGYSKEFWGNYTLPSVKAWLKKRMDMAKKLGFKAIEMDNSDIYATNNNAVFKDKNGKTYRVSLQTAAAALNELADYAHSVGLAIFLKNSGNAVELTEKHFDGVFNESCFEFDECDDFDPFIKNGKPVFIVNYNKCGTKAGAISINKYKGVWPFRIGGSYFQVPFELCEE